MHTEWDEEFNQNEQEIVETPQNSTRIEWAKQCCCSVTSDCTYWNIHGFTGREFN